MEVSLLDLRYCHLCVDLQSKSSLTLQSHRQRNQFELDDFDLVERYPRCHRVRRIHRVAQLNLCGCKRTRPARVATALNRIPDRDPKVLVWYLLFAH